MKLYFPQVLISSAHDRWCSVNIRDGEFLIVEGERMVKEHGIISPATDWVSSAALAHAVAAKQILKVIEQLNEVSQEQIEKSEVAYLALHRAIRMPERTGMYRTGD